MFKTLRNLYDRLRRVKQVAPDVEPEVAPDVEPEVAPDAEPEVAPEPVTNIHIHLEHNSIYDLIDNICNIIRYEEPGDKWSNIGSEIRRNSMFKVYFEYGKENLKQRHYSDFIELAIEYSGRYPGDFNTQYYILKTLIDNNSIAFTSYDLQRFYYISRLKPNDSTFRALIQFGLIIPFLTTRELTIYQEDIQKADLTFEQRNMIGQKYKNIARTKLFTWKYLSNNT